ncbi:MAG: excinuclease ABC subunit UvrA, partial [Bradymonadaceae bacterium]
DIPQGAFTAITGVSGAGKSSLAFDTLYAEGQRRYTESLSTYARQFLRRMERPPADELRDVQPAIALKQKNDVSNARSTVGTVTEVDDHLQLLYTHAGTTVCPDCDREVDRDTPAEAAERLADLDDGTRLIVVAPLEADGSEQRGAILEQLVQEGYRRLYLDGRAVDVTERDVEDLLEGDVLPVVVDRLVVRPDRELRLSEAMEAGFRLGHGQLEVHFPDDVGREALLFDRRFRCNQCGRSFVEPKPVLFAFNGSLGACEECSGYGEVMGIDFDKVVPNTGLSLSDGAIAAFEGDKYSSYKRDLLNVCRKKGIPTDVPWEELSEEHRRFVRRGGTGWIGIDGFFDELQQNKHRTYVRIFLARYRGYETCPACEGTKLSEDARNVRIAGRPISDFWQMRIERARAFFEELELPDADREKVEPLLSEIRQRLQYLDTVGLGYLTLGRQSRTLSGGEMQRIHLASSLGRALTDTLYVLDEPTAGLHAVDTHRLLDVVYRLRDLGNTLVVVEHDPEVIEAADYVVELGPGGGEQGGEVLFEGPIEEFRDRSTVTSRALEERRELEPSPITEQPPGTVDVVGANQFNLDDVDVSFPRERLTAVSGVSGSGKSTLCESVLFNGWKREQGEGGVEAGAVRELNGLEVFDEVVMMDQSALGRSTRSNPLTYSGAYDGIRRVYSQTRRAQMAGLTMGDFSFNTSGGRCVNCEGTGVVTIEMHFLADIDVPCEECEGARFNERVLGAEYRGKNIADVFDMTIDEVVEFFSDRDAVVRKLEPLRRVGLGYLRAGQATAQLSGGEAQRLKLASYIAEGRKRSDDDPVLFIFDEPTVGLHLLDVETLVAALRELVDLGHTVVVIEHDIDFIAQCDHVVDLGPGAGPEGGTVVATGTPEEVAGVDESVTGTFLGELIG